ncbi:hypothetical protein ASPCAL01615 [Aspergillus calidoustus]|uniref:Transmembrane protein n=1 Tax=Aspergillus calidoustus TaxID=454130 RepID=A0A0U5FVE7_ASPCI|nr:hypothetical protein ASPCAL01615 [Aspergillus calidoustus]
MPFIKTIRPFKARKATAAQSPIPVETTTSTANATTSPFSPLEVEEPKLRKRDRVRKTLKKTSKTCRLVLRTIKKVILVVATAIAGVLGAVCAICLDIIAIALLFAWWIIKFVCGALVVLVACPFIALRVFWGGSELL